VKANVPVPLGGQECEDSFGKIKIQKMVKAVKQYNYMFVLF